MDEVPTLAPIVIMTETPGRPKGPAPEPGQHTDQVLARLETVKKLPTKGAHYPMPKSALEGVTLLDLGTVINGPLGCALVAELGGLVIRIEAPDGDWSRQGIQCLSMQRTMAGSEGVCLNLKTPEGQEFNAQAGG